jgi:hypothetical protein
MRELNKKEAKLYGKMFAAHNMLSRLKSCQCAWHGPGELIAAELALGARLLSHPWF